MKIGEHFKGIQFFWKGIKAAKSDMWASLQVLVIATIVLGTLMYFVEHTAQPDVYDNWYDPYVWGLMSYLGNPGKFSPGEPITMVGRWIAICISIIKILLFAVPAGLVANGFREAMAADKREKRLAMIHKRLRKKFNRLPDKSLREYLNSLPDKGGSKLKVLCFVRRNRPLPTLEMQMGVNAQDLFDAAMEFPEFRIHNLATARSSEEDTSDRFVMEHFPRNTSYGCCIDRGSNVTIISTSSYDENGTGWWSYYLALFGGFNYMSKDVEVDMDDIDSFYNFSKEPTFEKKELKDIPTDSPDYAEACALVAKKTTRRKEFMDDAEKLLKGHKNSWVFTTCASIKNKSNTADLHVATNSTKGTKSSIVDVESFENVCAKIQEIFDDLGMEWVNNSTRYPLLLKNVIYHLQNRVPCNGVSLRPSSDVLNFDNRSLLIAFRMSQAIGESVAEKWGIRDADLPEVKPGVGYLPK